jgi:hypothetical protein
MTLSSYCVPVGSTIHRTGSTLKELEEQLAECRRRGAPDSATVVRTPVGSVYAAEVMWIAEEGS